MAILRWNEKENRYLKQKFNTVNFKELLACLETIKIEADKCKTQWDQWAQSCTTSQSIQELPEDSREKLESGSVLRDKLKIFGEELTNRILREKVNALFAEEAWSYTKRCQMTKMRSQKAKGQSQKTKMSNFHKSDQEPEEQDEQLPQDLLTMLPA